MPGFLPGTLRASANPLPADLSRLEQISAILDISLTDLIGLEDRGIFNIASSQTHFNNHIHSSLESAELAHDLSKSQMENDYTLRGHKLRFLDCPHPSPLPVGEGEQSRNL